MKVPTNRELEQIDETWPALRRPSDVHHHWRWLDIAKRHPECFAVTAGESIAALWAAKGPIVLPDGRFFRVDYLEVAAQYRGGDLGYFGMALMWARGAELGCKGMVCPALPETAAIFDGMGGIRRCIDGWQIDPRLVPFVFVGEPLKMFSELLEELSDEGDDQGETKG